MAPEVYKGEPYGPGVDIYSLGIVLYRLLNNLNEPFLTDDSTIEEHETAFVRRIKGEQLPLPVSDSGELARIILKASSYSPLDRYSNPTEMREDLEKLVNTNDRVLLFSPYINTKENDGYTGTDNFSKTDESTPTLPPFPPTDRVYLVCQKCGTWQDFPSDSCPEYCQKCGKPFNEKKETQNKPVKKKNISSTQETDKILNPPVQTGKRPKNLNVLRFGALLISSVLFLLEIYLLSSSFRSVFSYYSIERNIANIIYDSSYISGIVSWILIAVAILINPRKNGINFSLFILILSNIVNILWIFYTDYSILYFDLYYFLYILPIFLFYLINIFILFFIMLVSSERFKTNKITPVLIAAPAAAVLIYAISAFLVGMDLSYFNSIWYYILYDFNVILIGLYIHYARKFVITDKKIKNNTDQILNFTGNTQTGNVLPEKDESLQNLEYIKQLKEMMDHGIITREEFESKKKKLLNL